jgi:hypothetical protein
VAAVVAALAGCTAGPVSRMIAPPSLPIPPAPVFAPIAPIAPPVADVVVPPPAPVVDVVPLPVVEVAPPVIGKLVPSTSARVAPPATSGRRDGVSDRDNWARETWANDGAAPVAGRFVPETPAALKGPIARAAAKYRLPTSVLSAALARESANFKDRYVYGYHVDGTGRGVAGIDKRYHPEVTDEQALNPEFAVDWMGHYLSGIVLKNGGDLYSALREYNGGPNFDSSRTGYQGRSVAELTRTHADAIMAHAARAI